MPYPTEVSRRLSDQARQIIARYPQPRSALLPMLHLVQGEEGFVSTDGIELCAGLLDLTTAEVSAVATFYSQYKRHPNGTYTVGVCINTLCAVMGGDAVYDALEDHLGVGHDETTPDGAITLERIECNAACDYAPVVMVNWEFFDNQTPATARDLCDRLRAGEPVAPTRGAASVATFREVSHVLAGFDDGRANEGVGAGEASRRGTVLAAERGWQAPSGRSGRSLSDVRRAGQDAARDAAARAASTSGTDATPTEQGQERGGRVAGSGGPGTTAGKSPAEAGGAGATTPTTAPPTDRRTDEEA